MTREEARKMIMNEITKASLVDTPSEREIELCIDQIVDQARAKSAIGKAWMAIKWWPTMRWMDVKIMWLETCTYVIKFMTWLKTR